MYFLEQIIPLLQNPIILLKIVIIDPAQLAKLVQVVRELGVPPLFVEPQYDDMAARTLADETGAQVYTLDPVVTGPVGDAALTYYEEAMRTNMQTLQVALQ